MHLLFSAISNFSYLLTYLIRLITQNKYSHLDIKFFFHRLLGITLCKSSLSSTETKRLCDKELVVSASSNINFCFHLYIVFGFDLEESSLHIFNDFFFHLIFVEGGVKVEL